MVGVRLASTRVWRRGLRGKISVRFGEVLNGLVDGVSGVELLLRMNVFVLM